MARFTVLLSVAVFAVALWGTNADDAETADTLERIDSAMGPVLASCNIENGYNIDVQKLRVSRNNTELETINPCVLECMFKKMDVIDAKGFYDEKNFIESAGTFLNRPGDAEKIVKVVKGCAPANKTHVFDKCDQSRELLYCIFREREKVGL